MQLTFALRLTLGAGALAGCEEAKSLVGLDDEEDQAVAALTLSTEDGTVPPNGATTVHVVGTRANGEPARDGAPGTLTATLGSTEPSEFRLHGGKAAVTFRAGAVPGMATLTAKAGEATTQLSLPVQPVAPPPAPPPTLPGPTPPGPVPPPPGNGGVIDLTQVVWLDPDVSRWAETSRITGASIGDPPICIEHTKAGRWPVKDGAEGNPWVFVNLAGRWHAATYEWLRPGQTCKGIDRNNIGPHIKRPPLSTWRPAPGELVGLMVSARARFRADTVRERSNVVMRRWP
jgi:hypothetical protein